MCVFFYCLGTRSRPDGVLGFLTARRVFGGKSDVTGTFRRSFLKLCYLKIDTRKSDKNWKNKGKFTAQHFSAKPILF